MTDLQAPIRFTSLSHGGGCACKLPPGMLDDLLRPLTPSQSEFPDLLVGTETGDDAAIYALDNDTSIVATIDYFSPVVDDGYDWGQIAAANALSDVYAMGGTPLLGLNVLGWPIADIDIEHSKPVLEGGRDKALEARTPIAGGHSIDAPEPIYGLAVVGLVKNSELLTNSAAAVGLPLTLTKPLGVGILNNRHKKTGQSFPAAIATMKELNLHARNLSVANGLRCATDITGFGLLGHALKMARASGVTIEIDAAAVPYLDDVRESAESGYVSGGTRRNLKWVRPHLTAGDQLDETDLLMLADAQTSGGLLVVGEIPGHPIIGEVRRAGEAALVVR